MANDSVNRLPDCTCSGWHCDDVDAGISTSTLGVMIRVEECPVERRALIRVQTQRIMTGQV